VPGSTSSSTHPRTAWWYPPRGQSNALSNTRPETLEPRQDGRAWSLAICPTHRD
jgi:hypothetical protein